MSRIHPNPREVEMIKSQKLLILTSRKLFVGPGSMLVKGKQMHDVLSDEALKERGWTTSLTTTRCSSSCSPGLSSHKRDLVGCFWSSSGDPTAVLSTFFAREAFYHIVFWNFDLAKYVWQWRWWLRWRWQWRWLQWRWQWCAKSAAVSIQGQHSGEAGLKFFPQRREKAQLSLLEYNDDNIMITAFQKGAFTTQVNNPHQQSITPLQSYNVTTSSSRDISSSPVFTFSLIFKIGLKLGSIQAILKSRSCLTSLVESNVWQCLKTEHEGTRGDRTTCAHVWPRILTWKLAIHMIVYVQLWCLQGVDISDDLEV